MFMMSTGSRRVRPFEIDIDQHNPTKPLEPFTPASMGASFCCAGNSLCFGIMVAHAMGAMPIICSGFTLQGNTGYFFHGKNPVTKQKGHWPSETPLDWLRWYAQTYPGRVLLDPNFDGPIYHETGIKKASPEDLGLPGSSSQE